MLPDLALLEESCLAGETSASPSLQSSEEPKGGRTRMQTLLMLGCIIAEEISPLDLGDICKFTCNRPVPYFRNIISSALQHVLLPPCLSTQPTYCSFATLVLEVPRQYVVSLARPLHPCASGPSTLGYHSCHRQCPPRLTRFLPAQPRPLRHHWHLSTLPDTTLHRLAAACRHLRNRSLLHGVDGQRCFRLRG